MSVNQFVKLASSIAQNSNPASIGLELLDAVRELEETLRSLDEKLDRVLREPFTTATRLTEDATRARGAYRERCLTEARLKFITAQSFEGPALMKIRASFCAGVCADLLTEPRIALADYEHSYDLCVDEEAHLWSRGITEATWQGAKGFSEWFNCGFGSRREMLINVMTVFRNSFFRGSVHEPRNAGLNELYPVMRPIADTLKKRGSRVSLLTASSELRTDNYDRGAQLNLRHLDTVCSLDSHYWQTK